MNRREVPTTTQATSKSTRRPMPRPSAMTARHLQPDANLTAGLRGAALKHFMRAFADARFDPQVAPVTRHADFTLPRTRSFPRPQSSRGANLPTCGGVTLIDELTAPLFIASERPRMLAREKAPYGMRMGGKTDEQMHAKIRQYLRNTSLPTTCRYSSCAVVGSSGALRGGSLGGAIDSHDAIFRINAAPTYRHSRAVGTRTTWRIHNSEKPFMMAASGLPELQVAICHMGWIGSCQHQAFSGAYPTTLAYINPRFYSQLFSVRCVTLCQWTL